MKKNICAVAILLSSCLAVAGLPMEGKIPLWPEGKIPDFQEQQIAATTEEAKAPGFAREANRMPHIQWFVAPKDAPPAGEIECKLAQTVAAFLGKQMES